MHRNVFGGRAPPGPAGGACSAPPDPLAGFKGAYRLLVRERDEREGQERGGPGRGGVAPNFLSRFGGIEAPD